MGLLGHQPGSDHDARVRGVGAGGDGGNRHGTVAQLEGASIGQADRNDSTRVGGVVGNGLLEGLLRLGDEDTVLRTLRAGDGRLDRREVELHVLGVAGLAIRVVPHALGIGVGLDEFDLGLVTTGEAQVVQGDVVDREDGDGRAVLRAHVAQGGAVGKRHGGDAGAVELDELADDLVLTKHLGDRQDEVGGGDAVRQLTGELEAHDTRNQHGNRLTEHGGLGLDATHTPADDAKTVDHGGVGVGADAGVRVGDLLAVLVMDEGHAGEVLDVDLVDDAGARRDDTEVLERGLAPTQELVALTVALVLDVLVLLEGLRGAEALDDDGVVDDHLGG